MGLGGPHDLGRSEDGGCVQTIESRRGMHRSSWKGNSKGTSSARYEIVGVWLWPAVGPYRIMEKLGGSTAAIRCVSKPSTTLDPPLSPPAPSDVSQGRTQTLPFLLVANRSRSGTVPFLFPFLSVVCVVCCRGRSGGVGWRLGEAHIASTLAWRCDEATGQRRWR